MQNALPLIIELISGAVGGNIAGSLFKKLSLGTILNSIIGIIGGGLGGELLSLLGIGTTTGGVDLASVVGGIAGGGVGGGVLLAIIGFVKNLVTKKS
ncbi:hypothetical protein JXO59_05470 [candidate division KSB1 bacterium]|nr:hypothetical protein [candidate division KSB1 bacterium]